MHIALHSGCGRGCSRPSPFRTHVQLTDDTQEPSLMPSPLPALPLHSHIWRLKTSAISPMLSVATLDLWSCGPCVHWSENSLRTKGPLTCLFPPRSLGAAWSRARAVTFLSSSRHLSRLFSSDSGEGRRTLVSRWPCRHAGMSVYF